MRHNPQPQEIYRHFKGNLYQVRCLAKHSETGEMMVVYQAMYGDFQLFVRPLSSFMEEVDRGKYPDAMQHYRFEIARSDSMPGDAATAVYGRQVETEQAENIESIERVADDEPVLNEEAEEELNIDPLVMQFLEADTYERRLEILSMLHPRINDDMINTMAVAVDIEVKDGEIEDRYEELKNCLLTFKRYECSRLR